jgi:hypothetical protein
MLLAYGSAVHRHPLGRPGSARRAVLDVSLVHHVHNRDCCDCAIVPYLSLLDPVRIPHISMSGFVLTQLQITQQGVDRHILCTCPHRRCGRHLHDVHNLLVPHLCRAIQERGIGVVSDYRTLFGKFSHLRSQPLVECDDRHRHGSGRRAGVEAPLYRDIFPVDADVRTTAIDHAPMLTGCRQATLEVEL